MKKIIEEFFRRNKLILTTLILVALLIGGAQFFAVDFPKDAPQPQGPTQSQDNSVQEAEPPSPLIRKDTYTISSENPPYITWASFDPLDYQIGETQTVLLKINNELSAEKVTVTMITDDASKMYELKLTESTDEGTTWEGSWVVAEGSKDYNYQAKLEAYGSADEYSKVVVTFR